jgi:hypothetical protein
MSEPIRITNQAANEMGWTFTVQVGEPPEEYKVTVYSEDHHRLTKGMTPPDELVEKSFEFLLEREPKESILRSFNINVISQYFPDYEKDIQARVRQR